METKKLNILIVEDEFIVAADIEESLKHLGYEVQNTVASGAAAIAEVERNLPDIILMDIVLKGEMSGIEAASIIQQHHDVPVIYLTANADVATVDKAKMSLPYGYIIKPFTDTELQTNIEIAYFKFQNDVKFKIENEQFNRLFQKTTAARDEIIVQESNGLGKIMPQDVYYIRQTGAGCMVYLADAEIALSLSLDDIALQLPKEAFIRVNEQDLINLQKIFIVKLPDLILADLMAVITVSPEFRQGVEQLLANRH